MNARLHMLLSLKLICTMVLTLYITPFAFADQTGDTIKVNIHGILKRKPCHINNDEIIAIDFGNVGVNKIDGQRYIQPIDYKLECEDPDDAATLKMTLKGSQTSYNTGAIMTNIEGLGIKILQNGTELIINQSFTIDYNNPPELQAVPIASGKALTEGAFSATATLLAEYE